MSDRFNAVEQELHGDTFLRFVYMAVATMHVSLPLNCWYARLPLLVPRALRRHEELKMVRFVVVAALVALASYQVELVRADDALNGRLTEAFGK